MLNMTRSGLPGLGPDDEQLWPSENVQLSGQQGWEAAGNRGPEVLIWALKDVRRFCVGIQ